MKKVFKIVVLLLIIIETSFIYLTCMSYSNKKVNKHNQEYIIDNKIFAMYIENDNGEYEEIFDNTHFPSDGHKLNQDKSQCLDTDGNVIPNILVFEAGNIKLTTNKSVFCYLYFDVLGDLFIKPYTINDSGATVNQIPYKLGYNKTISCDNATATWNSLYNRLEINSLSGEETNCNITYKKDTGTYSLLKNVVENNTIHETFKYPKDDATWTALDEDEYKNVIIENNEFAYNNGNWVMPGITEDDNRYDVTFNPPNNNHYRICYSFPKSQQNYFYIYINSKQLFRDEFNSSDALSGCVYIGYLTSTDTVTTTVQDYVSNGYFWFEKTSDEISIDGGYRYEGASPNNFVWFNNELWRIIGSIPVKIDSAGTTKNLVKIIRNEPFSGAIYDNYKSGYWGSSGSWDDNSLYNLLNNHYYAPSSSDLDGTNSGYCYKNYGIQGVCNFSANGILQNSDYGNMIENVYWNTGSSRSSINGSMIYMNELSKQTTKGYIGLMNLSDYAFGTSEDKIMLDSYVGDYFNNNWLNKYPLEYTITEYYSTASFYNRAIGTYSYFGDSFVSNSYTQYFRPVVYLNSTVYVTSGIGSITTPYQIAMR